MEQRNGRNINGAPWEWDEVRKNGPDRVIC